MGACGSSTATAKIAVDGSGAVSAAQDNERAVSSNVDVTSTVVDECVFAASTL